jgi:hypothetical protein
MNIGMFLEYFRKKGRPQGKSRPPKRRGKNDKDSRHAIESILSQKLIVSMLLMAGRLFVSQASP